MAARMEPLDLSKRAPRGPREQLDGLVMLPRTIDKFRASLPGGVLGGYKIDGVSRRLLGWLGVDEAEMQAAVAAAASDDDVAKWVRARTDASAYDSYNERMENRSLDDIQDKTHMNDLYPWLAQSGIKKVFDIMEEDDRRTFNP
jgi:hypothetical protein